MAKKVEGNGVACAVLSYVLIGVVWYFVDDEMKRNRFARFHVRQAVALLLLAVIVSILGLFPILGPIIKFVGGILVMILLIFGLIYSVLGKENRLPLIGAFAEKIAL